MLKNNKNVNKMKNIVIALIMVIMVLGIYIKVNAATITPQSGTTVIPQYKPEWEKVSSAIDTSAKTLTVTLKGKANQPTQNINSNLTINYSTNVTSTLALSDIQIFVDGVDVTSRFQTTSHATNPWKELKLVPVSAETANVSDVTYQLVLHNFNESVRQTGIPFKEISGNIKLKIKGRGEDTTTYSENVLKDNYGNQNMMETDEGQSDGTWIDVTFEDTKTDHNTNGTMFTDLMGPEITYRYSETVIGDGPGGDKKVKVVFDVIDKYFANTSLSTDTTASLITVKVDNENVNSNIIKTLAKKTIASDATGANGVTYKANGDIYYTVDGTSKKVGERYELVVDKLEQTNADGIGNGYSYSGPMHIVIPDGIIADNSGNTNEGNWTLTIGVDEIDGDSTTGDGGTAENVDVVDPVWVVAGQDIEQQTITLIATDKYFDFSSLPTNDEIKNSANIYVNGYVSTQVTKEITGPTYVKWDSATSTYVISTQSEANGVEYILKLGKLEPGEDDAEDYIGFVPKNANELVLDENGKAYYRNEYGGSVKIKMASGILKDKSTNVNKEQTFDIGVIDTIKPEVYDVQKIQNPAAGTETIVFNVTDKNYVNTDLVEQSEITVKIDGETVTGLITSFTNKEIIESRDVGVTTKDIVVGHQYTLVLSVVEGTKQSGKDYLEHSGTLEVIIAEQASKDIADNYLNTETTTIRDFIDFIKPELTPVTVTEPIGTSTYTASFKVVDKYIDSADKITGDEIKVYIDGEEATSIAKSVSETPIKATFKKTVGGTIADGKITNVIISDDTEEHIIGYTYTVVLSGFEQSTKQTADNKDFYEWSGTVKIVVNQDAVKDKNGITNAEINTLDADETKRKVDGHHVDFIKPKVEFVSKTPNASAKTETIVFDVIDKYLETTNMVELSEITVKIDGQTVTTSDVDMVLTPSAINNTINKTVGGTLYENRSQIVGYRYTLALSNFEKGSRNGENYRDWSGTVTLELNADAAKDTNNNNLEIPARDQATGNAHDTSKVTSVTDTVNKVVLVGDCVDYVKPDIVQGTSTKGTSDYTMTFTVTDKYNNLENDEVTEDEITVYIDGEDATEELTISLTLTEISKTINKTVGGTITTGTYVIGHTYTLELSGFEQSDKRSGLDFYDWSGKVTVVIDQDAVADESSNQLSATEADRTLTGEHIDFIKPKVEFVSKTKDTTAKTETIVFDVIDKYIDSTDEVEQSEITVKIDGETVTTSDIDMNLTSTPINNTINKTVSGSLVANTSQIVGYRYTLLLSNFEKGSRNANNYKDWSGTVTLEIAQTAVKDLDGITGNTVNNIDSAVASRIITGDFVDFVKPDIVQGTSTKGTSNYTMTFSVTDKYINSENEVTEDEITVYVDGEDATDDLIISLTPTEISKTFNKTVSGAVTNGTYVIGHTYTLELSGFEQSTKNTGKDFYDWSGRVTVVIDQDAVADESSNQLSTTLADRTLTGETVDFIKPKVEFVSKTIDKTTNPSNPTETIVFDVIDKYIDSTDKVELNEITVKIDGETVTSTDIGMDLTSIEINNTINKTVNGSLVENTSQIVGYRYTLVLSDFEKATRNAKGYKDYSGTVTIEIAQTAVKDLDGITGNTVNNLDSATTSRIITGDFVDFIKPDLKYTFSTSDIDRGNDTYQMVFDITDKYYTSGQLDLSDLTILMHNGKETVNLYSVLASGDVTLGVANKYATNINYTETNGTLTTNKSSVQIGHTYTLTIKNLDQGFIDVGDTTANYSGVITVAVPADKIVDRSSNKNIATTLTSKVSVEGGGIQGVVDTVKPMIEKYSSTAYAVGKTATITFDVTDTYYVEGSTLTIDDVQVIINGTSVNPTGVTKNFTNTETLEETRYTNSGWNSSTNQATTTTETVQYGVRYTLAISGYETDVKQVKIKIPEGKVVDQFGNVNRETEIVAYNVLKVAKDASENWEDAETDIFLGGPTTIQRQNIHKIIFVNSLSAAPITVNADGTITLGTNCWDVSAQGDKSILAWTAQTSAPYTVYIGSDYEIFANQSSNYLFSYIGYSENCTATQTVEGLNLLNTGSVTNMSYMFNYFGYDAMTGLTLPTTFNTSNVTDMRDMFNSCGYKAMISLTLPTTFDTSNVTDMLEMFRSCGYTAMTSLTLPQSFDTSSVIDMQGMFYGCGYKAMSSLDIGDNFNTSNVTYMGGMFYECGYTAMTSLDLSSGTNNTNTTQFNTSSVTNMNGMFVRCGYTAMTNLNLGNNFDTRNVTNMSDMFYACGYKAMTSLDLRDKFDTTNVTNMYYMFIQCGFTAMTSLDLGDNFNTSNVTNMQQMFNRCGATAMTSLDLGDKFDTTNVTNMLAMFANTTALTTLDLGPAFTKIPDGTITGGTHNGMDAYYAMFSGCGTPELTIYAPESIYSDMKHFKTSTDSTTTIALDVVDNTTTPVTYRGTINPVYKPEWIKFSSSLTIEEAENLEDSTMTIIVDAKVDETIYAKALRTITYALTEGNDASNLMKVKVDGEIAEEITQTVTINTRATELVDGDITYKTNGDIYAKINGTDQLIGKQYKIVLSDFAEEVRQSGKKFREWTGNVALQFAKGSLTDAYGNKSMTEIDINPADLSIKEPIQIEDETKLTANVQTDKMFADYIKPEITYVSSDTTINHGLDAADEYVTVEFDVTDKYFNSATFTKDDIIVKVTDTNTDISSNITKNLEKLNDINYTVDGVSQKIGERYKLTITGLDKGDGITYSGPMSITIPDGKITDKSGNASIATTTSFQIGVNQPGGSETGDIVDVVDPIWSVENIQRNIGATPSASTVTMDIIATDKYIINSIIDSTNVAEKITVKVDEETPDTAYVTRTISSPEYLKEDGSGNYVTATQAEATRVKYTLTLSNWTGPNNEFTDANSSPSEDKQYQDYSGTTKITIASGTITDQYTNTSNVQEFDLGHVDFIKPVVNSVSTTKGTNTETIVFDVLDKYIDTTDNVSEDEITVYIDGEEAGDITKQIINIREIKEGSNVVGKQYTLQLSDFEKSPAVTKTSTEVSPNDSSTVAFKEFSGTVTIVIDADAVKDRGISGDNTNVNILDSAIASRKLTAEHVDFIKPVVEEVSKTKGTDTETIIFNVIDKYLDTSDIVATNEITVYLDGEAVTIDYTKTNTDQIHGELTKVRDYTYTTTPVEESASKTLTVAQQYQLVLSNFAGTKTKESATSDDGSTATFKEWSGTVSVKVNANAVEDTSNYKNAEKTITAHHIDSIKPVVEEVSITQDTTAKTETIVFNVIDKYLDTTDEVETSEITVYVDGVPLTIDYTNSSVTGIDGTLTKLRDYTYTTTPATGYTSQTFTVAHQYELVLSNFEQVRTPSYGSYTEYSGTVSIEISSNAVKDTSNNNLDTDVTKRTIIGDFVDFIKPDITYIYSSSDIDYDNKTFQMVFDIVDKYYDETNSSTLTNSNLASYLEIKIDGEDITENAEVTKTITSSDIEATMMKTTTIGTVPTTEGTYKIGKRYTLTLSNLEQVLVDTGENYLDYSGIVTVVVKNNTVKDSIGTGNVSTTTTMQSGLNNPGGSGSSVVVDVVDPLWESAGFTTDIHNQTATIIVKGTDKYFFQTTTDDKAKLTENEIEIYVDGVKDTTLTPVISEETYLPSTGDKYGVQYKITLNEFDITKNQIKIRLLEGALIDQSGNESKETEFMVYNALKVAKDADGNWEDAETDVFLGGPTTIQRQKIHKIIFVNSLSGAPITIAADGTITLGTKCWDVSAVGDKSILAWTTGSSSPYTVYIGSNSKMYANYDSSYLFSYIGSATSCTATETIKDIYKLDTRVTANMSYMFSNCGSDAMTTLQLGNNFDTSNVTNMSNMFVNCGFNGLETFSLGSNFDTSSVTDMSSMFEGLAKASSGFTTLDLGASGVTFKTNAVTDMSNMFKGTGHTSMTSFSLGNDFDTSSVTDMSGMFQDFAYTLDTLTLGNNFKTISVTNMSNMFNGTGKTAMTNLDLGTNFNTTTVTNMSGMFQNFANESVGMTALDLGDLFSTTAVTDMSNMFNGCGTTAMTSLDLGPAFTKITSTNTGFVTSTGTTNAIIFAPESIYSNRNSFKLNTSETSGSISYTIGKINPVYRPEWEKVSATLDITPNTNNKEITITFKGYANESFGNGTYTGSYLSDITSSITEGNDSSNLLVVKVDGQVAEEITQTVTEVSVAGNEVQYTIKLSGFEELSRQSGKNFLEWSGNIAVQPVKGTLIDDYGNKNMTSIDYTLNNVTNTVINPFVSDGKWYDIEFRDTTQDGSTSSETSGTWTSTLSENTTGKMFTDYIKPEFTYEYYNASVDTDANTVIDYTNNKITIVFDVTDKYFESTTLATDTTGSNITVKVDNDADANTAITKALSKKTIDTDKTINNITYKTNGDIYYTVNGVSKKIGERYELVITGLESSFGVGYSGPMTLGFLAGAITDESGNTSDATTITIGIDEPNSHPEHNTEQVVDVVNPIWSYADSEIDRTNKQVNIYLIGSDKYYKVNTLDIGDITVYVDGLSTDVDTDRDGIADAAVSGITKHLEDITDDITTERLNELIAGAGLTSMMTADNNLTSVGVVYKLTLSTFGTISGETKFDIAENTLEDNSGNKNKVTTIDVGNVTWTETGDNVTTPRYPAFRNDIVDFIAPKVNYSYSVVAGDENPDVDYVRKIVTLKFTVTDKYLLESDLIKTDGEGNLTTLPKNMAIKVDGTTVYDSTLETQNYQVTASITESNIANGKLYTLVVSNIQQHLATPPTNTTPENGDGINFSGPMQVVITAGAIDDTSGNKNIATTISLDTEIDTDIVDVVDPIVKYNSSFITREDDTVTLRVKAEDKYFASETLSTAENTVKVKIVDEYGNVVVNDATTIAKDITVQTSQSQYKIFNIVLSDFGVYEGKTSVIIPAGVILDSSGNGNLETEILVGNADDPTAFKDSIVDFTKPVWEYVTSSIQRNRPNENGTVTLEVKGTDIYFDKDTYFTNVANQLDLSQVKVYVDGVENTSITKSFALNADSSIKKEYIEETKTLATGYNRVLKGVKYTLVLGNFGTNEGQVKIEIPANAIRDISLNGNDLIPIYVGNPTWIETDVEVDAANPKYTAFRPITDVNGNVTGGSIVDYIKPVIKYQYVEGVNPILNRDINDEYIQIKFTATDTNFLESDIGLEDMKIYIDNMQVYGTGTEVAVQITPTLETPVATASNDGLEYTLKLSALELNTLLAGEIFERHSGVIKIVIAADQVADTSGNKNIETTFIIDTDNGDDSNGITVDFVNPIIYYQSKYVNWQDRYALITLRATDRFFDTTTELQPSDITLYEENDAGQYVQITSIPQSDISITKVSNGYGYDYIIKLSNFEEEFKMKVKIRAGAKDADDNILYGIADTSGNVNDETEIIVPLDNKRPTWEYVNTDTTKFETDGEISFNVKGLDKYLDLTNSTLANTNLKVLRDGVDITNVDNITVTHTGDDATEKSKSYSIKVTGLTQMGTYSLVFEKDTLVDTFGNKNAATTISFSNSVIASNTGNYTNVTYHVTPDMTNVHSSYVHELMSVNTTGTNFENTTYRPSTLGELLNNGENPLFAEPMYVPTISDYTVSSVYSPKSFAGWAEADEDGNIITGGTVYGLYDEIPRTITNLKAVWQDATVVFVSASAGDNSSDGKIPTNAVQDLATAYSKLNPSGTAENNIIVIMDAVEHTETATYTGNATITSVYAGVDYRLAPNNAELKISSNMIINGDIIFDNIELYSDSTTVSNGSNYLANGTYTNMLISNYSGDITIGRGVVTSAGKYTFGAIIGGNFKTETSTGELGTHTIRVEAGKYNNIIAGSALSSATDTTKSITHNIVIGNMKDAAVSRNDKLTVTGYMAIGENEKKTYPSGSNTANTASSKVYANVTLYSGSFTGANKFAKADEDIAIYLRTIDGQSDGKMSFEMFGGDIDSNIYAGSRVAVVYPTQIFNIMKFYGGDVNGNIYGQGVNTTFTGSSTITLQGCFTMIGNIFGASNTTSSTNVSVGEGDSTITINSSSVTITGNVYGGGESIDGSTGFVTGNSNITLKAGTVSGVYGSGYNIGNTTTTNITIENGTVAGNIFGGAYNNQARGTSNITVLDGVVTGNIYGGNNNDSSQFDGDTYFQNVNITIGDITTAEKPKVQGTVFGGGKYDKVDVTTINLVENESVISVYGGSDVNATTVTANIYLKGMTVNEIYGGGQNAGTVAIANIYLQSGTVTDVYGGGFKANTTEANILLEGTATVSTIYGGPNTSGKVTTSNITLTSGTSVTDVFGGGNSAEVETSNVTLNGMTVTGSIYGGSKDAGLTTTSNVILTSGTVGEVFGGGLDVGVTTSNVKQQGATVTTIYGGNDSGTGSGGDTGTSNIEIVNATVQNIYGGNKEKGTTRYTNINIHGTSTVTGNVFGGGYLSEIGKSGETGSTTINIAGGTINGDINGGSEQSTIYGNTNINIGKDATLSVNPNLTAGNINIIGTIYGAGSTATYGTTTVVGNTNITMDNSTSSPITYFTATGKEKSIFGSGNGGAIYSNGTSTDRSTISIKDFGTSTTPYLFKSIEDTGNLYIGNSFVEISGALDTPDDEIKVEKYYSLSQITNALTIYEGTTLYTQRGFNKVGGFYSYVNKTSTKANVSITSGVATTNVDNRLYTLEGINLVFAKKEVTLTNKSTFALSDWGKVNGMAYFGVYKNTLTGKQYDLDLFRAGTYVEGRYDSSNHNINVDGFYTTVKDPATSTEKAEVITTVNYSTYCDWIVNAPTVDYEVDLVASTLGKQSIAELVLDYKYASDYTYAAGTVYTLNNVSSNALKPGIELVDWSDPTKLPTISSNANTKFGLSMETTSTGWQKQALTTIYSAGNGSSGGDTEYTSDAQTTPGTLKFKVYNSINITEEKDLGAVTIMFTGQQPLSGGATEAYTFNVVITVNLQTYLDDLDLEYTPSFKDRPETELNYTTDSKVDLSYILYSVAGVSPYDTGDYRVISTTEKLPAGTRITMKDYGQGDTVNKVYYYHVTGSENTTDGTRYLYRLSNFLDMGSINSTYATIENNIPYFNSTECYVYEKYDISIDFIDSGIDTNRLEQETYLELRKSNGSLKYDNGDTTIKYNLKVGQNAEPSLDIETDKTSYSVVENLDVLIDIDASILETDGVLDTKYYDKIVGIAIQIVGESGVRIKAPELQNFKLTNLVTNEVYEADANGVIRMPIVEGLGSKTGSYKLSMTQADVSPGLYTAQVILYTADDGKYYGTIPEIEPLEFNITFINKVAGLLGANVADESTRIINKTTGLNLVENSDVNKAIDMTLSVNNPTNETNIRVELYKRNPTYTNLSDETTFTGTSYTLVDMTDYINGTWEKPENHGLVSATGSKEYIVSARKNYATPVELETIEFENAIKTGISTGEYKLVFKAYSYNTLVQTFSKTFIVAP